MTYKLAKQLKDAGFPQDFIECDYCRQKAGSPTLCEGCLYRRAAEPKIPTLSELIEACGDGFEGMSRFDGVEVTNGWITFNKTRSINTFGQTPEAAVAKLWLDLRKEKV